MTLNHYLTLFILLLSLLMWTILVSGLTYAYMLISASKKANEARKQQLMGQVYELSPQAIAQMMAQKPTDKKEEKPKDGAAEFPPHAGMYL